MKNDHSSKMNKLYAEVTDDAFIDLWAAHYIKDELGKKILNERYLNKYRIKREEKVWRKYIKKNAFVLDCGCGRGYFSNRIINLFGGKINIYGMDIASNIIHKGKKENPTLNLIQADATKIAFKENTFDFILVVATFEHVQDTEKVITELKKILKINGIIYLTIHKNFIDPFIIPDIKSLILKNIKLLWSRTKYTFQIPDRYDSYTRNKIIVRAELNRYFEKHGFILLEKNGLISAFKWSFYKKYFGEYFVTLLIKVNSILNALNFNWYKDLEYQVWKNIE